MGLLFVLSRIPWDWLAWWGRRQRFIPGERLESEEATVCRAALEALPLRPALQERFLCSGAALLIVFVHEVLACLDFFFFSYSLIMLEQWHLMSYKNRLFFFLDCPSSSVCVYRPGIQPDCSSIWKVPQLGSASQHVWRTVFFRQVSLLFGIFVCFCSINPLESSKQLFYLV